jgi:hypothetical protein
MPRLWRKFDHDVAWIAAEKCLRDKWHRGDTRSFLEEWTGWGRHELTMNEYEHGQLQGGLKHRILEEVAMVVEDMVDGIQRGEDPQLEPVTVRPRRDGGTGKVRDIAMLCYRHQLLGHTVKIGIDKLLQARILPTQHASIPGKGQTGLARQIRRMLRRRLGIKYAQKIDGIHAYASIMYSKVAEIIRKETPRARWIHRCMRELEKAAPGGHLIIGGYIDAWLFNYVMSYGLRYVLSLKKSRRGHDYPMVIRAATFMDDAVLMARSESGLKQAVSKLSEWMADAYGMKCRTTTGILRIGTVKEEKDRKSRPGARRGVAAIDAGGYRISRTHTTIRKRNVPRIARCFDRAWEEYQRTGTIKRQRACQIISRNGMIRNANSRRFEEKYHVYEVMRVARRVQAYWSRVAARKRRESIRHAVERYEKQRAALCGADG